MCKVGVEMKKSNRQRLVGYARVVCLAVLSLMCCIPHLARAEDLLPKGEFRTTAGGKLSLSELRGSIVLLHFFASWCGECMLEAPSLNSLARSLASQDDIKVVGISIDDYPIAAKAFVERMKIPYPVIVDDEQRLKRTYAVRGVPMTMVLDRAGKPVAIQDPNSGKTSVRIVGPRDWSDPAIHRRLQELARPSEEPSVTRLQHVE